MKLNNVDEKRLIDANALYAKLGKMAREPYYQHDGEDYYVGIADASGEVADAPTVDAVEVVRCKDCIGYVWNELEGWHVCIKHGKYGFRADDFCSYGERKD